MRKNEEINEIPKALRKETKDKKKRNWKKILLVFVILAIIGISSGGFLLYGPFSGFRDWLITTAMTTMTHQYLATWFLSENEINAIMAKLEVQNNENSDINAINIENIEEEKKENKITVEKITGKTYVRLCYANYGLYKS